VVLVALMDRMLSLPDFFLMPLAPSSTRRTPSTKDIHLWLLPGARQIVRPLFRGGCEVRVLSWSLIRLTDTGDPVQLPTGLIKR
jgi:hypothetical protein